MGKPRNTNTIKCKSTKYHNSHKSSIKTELKNIFHSGNTLTRKRKTSKNNKVMKSLGTLTS